MKLAMIENWMYTWEEWRLFWSKVKGQILSLTTSFIGEISRTEDKVLGEHVL